MPATRSSSRKTATRKTKAPASTRGRPRATAGSERARKQQPSSQTYLNPLPRPQVPPVSGKRRKLLVCGTGGEGQFGLGPDTTGEIKRPRLHGILEHMINEGQTGASGIERIAAGGMHSLLVDSLGQIWSFGINDSMALGRITKGPDIDSDEAESTPHLVEGLTGFRAVSVAASDNLSLAVSDKGELRAWGLFKAQEGFLGFGSTPGGPRQVGMPQALAEFAKIPVFSVSCGENHVLALTCTGLVYAWGDGEHYQLGRQVLGRRRRNGLRPEPLHLRNIVVIGTGYYTSFAVDRDGVVFAFGLNQMRQTGISDDLGGDSEIIKAPTRVDALHPGLHHGARVIQISGGDHQTIFLFDNGEVWGCGRCDEGRLGLPQSHPEILAIEEKYQAVLKEQLEATSKLHQSEVQNLGSSAPTSRRHGRPKAAPKVQKAVRDTRISEPVRIPFPPSLVDGGQQTKIVSISSGSRYSLACDEAGIMYSWGDGTSCQLGLGPVDTAETPTRVLNTALRHYAVVELSAGGQHVLISGVERDDPLPAEEP